MKKKTKTQNDGIDMFLLRSTYFNTPSGRNISPEFFYITLPSILSTNRNTEKFYNFMSAVYEQNFDNELSIDKLQRDYEKYYRSLDEKRKLE